MKYNININQKALCEMQLKNFNIMDAAILDFLVGFCGSDNKKIERMIFKEKETDYYYTWVNHHMILEQMPLLRLNQTDSISTRLKKIEKAGFIKLMTIRVGAGKRTYVRLTEKVDQLAFDTSLSVYTGSTISPDLKDNQSKLNDNNIRDNKHKDKITAEPLFLGFSEKENKLEKSLRKKVENEEMTKTEMLMYLQNQRHIDSMKEKFEGEEYNFPVDGKYDWRYLVNHGKTNPTKFFVAIYWNLKEKLSDGIYSYKFNSGDLALNAYKSEMHDAAKLSRLLTIEEFEEKINYVDDKAYDERLSDYKFEWKLSTVRKNLHNN